MSSPDKLEPKIEEFKAVSQSDDDTARFYLGACDGHLQRAINMFADQQQLLSSNAARSSNAAVHYAQQDVERLPVHPRRQVSRSWFGRVVHRLVGWVGYQVQTACNVVSLILSLFLPRSLRQQLMATTRSVLAALLPNPPHTTELLQATYGEALPQFVDAKWREALSTADAQQKMLFVYLHSPDHLDTDRFCRSVLNHPEVLEYIGENFVAWAGSITSSDAYQLSRILRVTTYPYVGIVTRSGNRRTTQAMQVMAAIEGFCEAGLLLDSMHRAVDAASAVLTQARQAQTSRNLERQMREEQDAALQASMAADRERETTRQAELAAAEAARLQAEKAENAQRAAKEAAERSIQERAANIVTRRTTAATKLQAEAPAGPGATLLRVRLANGSTSQRRFLISDPVVLVYDFVDSLADLSTWDYLLSSTYPRRDFPRNDTSNITFESAGLMPNATLMVTNLDD